MRVGQHCTYHFHLFWQGSVIITLCLFLTACSVEPDEQVKAFVEETNKKKSLGIEPLPTFHKIQPFAYSASAYKNPFETPNMAKAKTPVVPKRGGPLPDTKRARELLESYPIDSLKMVGTIQRLSTYWALIKDPHGIVHRVGVGNYIGENFGKIEKINGNSIEIHELVLDDQGNYHERTITMRIAE